MRDTGPTLAMSVSNLNHVSCRVEFDGDAVHVTRFSPPQRLQFPDIDALPHPVRSRLATLRILDDPPSDGIADVGMRVSENVFFIDCPYGAEGWD